jgi:hypothetical protein
MEVVNIHEKYFRLTAAVDARIVTIVLPSGRIQVISPRKSIPYADKKVPHAHPQPLTHKENHLPVRKPC